MVECSCVMAGQIRMTVDYSKRDRDDTEGQRSAVVHSRHIKKYQLDDKTHKL